ncbi:MAG: class I SAM-dependent methyltransferase [Deltaproteobacteria bacterium]|nr:class I SAM-dependent methyltransferase [Deltaproteobacteria bacterium]
MKSLWIVSYLAAALGLYHQPVWTLEEIPFVPTPIEVIDRMLELAEVNEKDTVYDLGSGDGRIVVRAAKKYGARAVGIEMDPELVELSRQKAREEGVSHLVEFRQEDALKVDVSPATVVTLYMLPWFNEKIRPVLLRHLRPGARVVSHDFGIEGWPPTEVVELEKIEVMPGGRKHRHRLLLWRIEGNSGLP